MLPCRRAANGFRQWRAGGSEVAAADDAGTRLVRYTDRMKKDAAAIDGRPMEVANLATANAEATTSASTAEPRRAAKRNAAARRARTARRG